MMLELWKVILVQKCICFLRIHMKLFVAREAEEMCVNEWLALEKKKAQKEFKHWKKVLSSWMSPL